MNNSMSMQILESIDNLHCVALHFNFMKTFSSSQKFIQTLILTQLEENIDIISVFKEMLELNNVLMLNGPVNFDLTHKLLFCPTLSKRCLKNDFSSCNCTSLLTCELITLGESTLSQKLAFDIATNLCLATLNYPFLYNGWHC